VQSSLTVDGLLDSSLRAHFLTDSFTHLDELVSSPWIARAWIAREPTINSPEIKFSIKNP